MRNNYCRYCSYNHCHIVGTRTPYLSRPPAPTHSMLFTNRKSANRKEVGQIVLSNNDWGKGGVCGPTTYDSDCRPFKTWITILKGPCHAI